MHEQWFDIFNTTRMLFFLVGLGGATWYYYNRCKREGCEIEIAPMGIIAGISVIVFMAIQQVGLATDMKECNAEFAKVLQQRAELSDQTDTLSGEMIEANSHWLSTLNNPPPDIALLHTTDPAYRAWVSGTLRDYQFQVSRISDERKQALEQRKEKQYPEPTCGK